MSLGAMDQATLVLQLFPESGEPVVAKTVVSNRPAKDWIELAVPNGPVKAARMRLEITDGEPGLPSHIEVRELKVK